MTTTMATKRRHDPMFRAEVSRRLRQKVTEFKKQGMSEAAAARQLGVSPQAFNQYLKGKATPKAHILARACTMWGLRISYKQKTFGPEAFAEPDPVDRALPTQLSLFSEPQAIANRNLTLRVGAGKADTLSISLEIRFAS
jgi:transcriptional regulator with XRE-family HTH domain